MGNSTEVLTITIDTELKEQVEQIIQPWAIDHQVSCLVCQWTGTGDWLFAKCSWRSKGKTPVRVMLPGNIIIGLTLCGEPDIFIIVSVTAINMKPPRIAVYLTYLEDLTKMSIHLKYQKINFRDILVKQFYRFLWNMQLKYDKTPPCCTKHWILQNRK